MTPKKYKHKKTGLIFNYAETTYVSQGGTTVLPIWLVKGSDDWEEVEEVLFTTEDGVEITSLGTTVYWTDASFRTHWGTFGYAQHIKYVPIFSSLEARDKYILENKPLFSVIDILEYMKKEGFTLITSKLEEYTTLLSLAQKKLNETI